MTTRNSHLLASPLAPFHAALYSAQTWALIAVRLLDELLWGEDPDEADLDRASSRCGYAIPADRDVERGA